MVWESGSIGERLRSPEYGHSPIDRRWDGTSMDQTLGAYTMLGLPAGYG